jgi:hypothetical protein
MRVQDPIFSRPRLNLMQTSILERATFHLADELPSWPWLLRHQATRLLPGMGEEAAKTEDDSGEVQEGECTKPWLSSRAPAWRKAIVVGPRRQEPVER